MVQIMSNTSFGFAHITSLIKQLSEFGMLERKQIGSRGDKKGPHVKGYHIYYKTTAKGKHYLKLYEESEKMIRGVPEPRA
jgi:predicted transcriptional regulator